MIGPNPTRRITEDPAREVEQHLCLPERDLDVERDAYARPAQVPTAEEAMTQFVVRGERAPLGLPVQEEIARRRVEACASAVIRVTQARQVELAPEKFATLVGPCFTSGKEDEMLYEYVDNILSLLQ